MELVKRRPIVLPVFKGGQGWYDDFAVTGANDSGYIVSATVKTKTTYGIIIGTPVSGGCDIEVPQKYCNSNVIIETVCRIVAGALITPINFRKTDWNNRWRVEITSTNVLQLQKSVAGVNTQEGVVNISSSAAWNRVLVEAIGARINVYHNGTLKISVVDTDLITNSRIHFSMYDGSIPCRGEYQYYAVKPL